MEAVQTFIDRARVVLTAAVTYITLAATVVQVVILQYGDAVPAVAQYGGALLAFLLGVVAVIRRVTPVEREERGLLSGQ